MEFWSGEDTVLVIQNRRKKKLAVPGKNRMSGCPQELQDIMECLRDDRELQSNVMLGG